MVRGEDIKVKRPEQFVKEFRTVRDAKGLPTNRLKILSILILFELNLERRIA